MGDVKTAVVTVEVAGERGNTIDKWLHSLSLWHILLASTTSALPASRARRNVRPSVASQAHARLLCLC